MSSNKVWRVGGCVMRLLAFILWLMGVAISIVSMLFATDHLAIAIGAFSCGLAVMTVFHWWMDSVRIAKEKREKAARPRIVESIESGRVEYL